MTQPIKILVLNDDSLPAMTVYDHVLQHGFKILNRPFTKERYQSHPSYNELLNESSELSRRFFFEPSDLYAPLVKIDAVDEGDIPKNTPRLDGLDKWLTEAGMRSLLEQSDITALKQDGSFQSKLSELSPEDLELSAMLQVLQQGEPSLRALGNGPEWLNTHVDGANQEGMPEATRKANLHLVEYVDPNKEEPLQGSELTWVGQSVFFTLDDYTNVDTKFIAQNFDGIFFICHAPLGSRVLPENLLSILTECDKIGLWLFNLHLDANPMINALNLKKGDFNLKLMQSLQSTEFQQLKVFLDNLIPRAEFAGCLTATDYESLAAFYAYGQDATAHMPALQLSHNVYQSLHYLNQVKSLCSTGFGLASSWQQGCALSAKAKLHGIAERAPNPLELTTSLDRSHGGKGELPTHHVAHKATHQASTTGASGAIGTIGDTGTTGTQDQTDLSPASQVGVNEQEGVESPRSDRKERADRAQRRAKVNAALAQEEALLKGCTVEQFPSKLFGCPFNKLSDWKLNTLPPEQNVDNYVPHILISSKYFNFNPILGMELMGSRLLVQILASFPEVNLSLVFNQCVYSWLADQPKDTILWQEQGELTTHDAFIERAKATHEVMSSAIRSRVMGDLRRHILATLNDQEGWPWTLEQRHNLESLVVKFDSPSAGKIFCFPRLTEAVLNLTPDVVISDVQSDLVRARSKGLATIELVESPSQWDGLAQYTRDKTYFENLALSSDIEQGAILRFSLDRIFNAQKGKTAMCSKQASSAIRNKLLLRGLAQSILCASAEAGGAALKLDKSSIYKNIKRLPSNYGFSSGYKLAWTDVLHKLDLFNHVFAEESLSEQINTCYNEHVALIRKIGVSLNKLVEVKRTEEQATQFKRAQLSNFTCAKRYYPQHLGLSYLAALAHSQGFGDGATLISKVGQFELSEVWQEQVLKLSAGQEGPHGQAQAKISELTQTFIQQGAHWPVFKPLSLSVLSFGCSRGDEIFDLLPLFNGQRFTGIDINEGAIKVAQQQLMNLPEVTKEQAQAAFSELYALPQQVLEDGKEVISKELEEIEGKLESILVKFAPESVETSTAHTSSQTTENALKHGESGACTTGYTSASSSMTSTCSTGQTSEHRPRLVQYLGAMGLVNFVSSKDFFAEYADKELPQFDVVTAMTVLCRHPETMFLLNANEVYPFSEFMDTLCLLDRMVKPGGLLCLFNSNYLLEDSQLASKYVGVYPFKLDPKAQGQDEQAASLRRSLAEVAQSCLAHSSNTVGQAGMASNTSIPLPRHYEEIYRERGLFDRGHVALFNPDGSMCAPRREEAMIIYYKKPNDQ